MREGGKFMSDTDESRAKLSSYSECTYFFVLRCFLKSERNFSCSDLHALQWPRLLAARSCRNQLSLIKICEVKVITIGLVWRLCHFQNIEEGIKAPVTFYLKCYPKGFSFWWEFLVVQFFPLIALREMTGIKEAFRYDGAIDKISLNCRVVWWCYIESW